MNWQEKYYNKNFHEKLNLTISLDELNLIKKESNLQEKINDSELTYQNKLKQIEDLSKTDIKDFEKQYSLELIEKEVDIIKLLSKYSLENKNLEYNFICNCLNLLHKLSKILQKRIGLKDIKCEKNNKVLIHRSSYKFCNFKDTCIYNYNYKHNSKVCYQDHFVHNNICIDIIELLKYIDKKKTDENLIKHDKEILKSINTMSFVICHMHNELKTKCLYLDKKNWEKMHYVNK